MYISLVLLAPAAVACIYKDWFSILPFVCASLIAITLGSGLKMSSQTASDLNDIKKSEGLFVVAASWVVFAVISAIPYLFYGLSPLNAMFEAASGITTTGATILTRFDYPKAFFFWRSFTQWLGGLGIIVLFVAVLPQFAVAGRQLFFAETPGPTEDKITPRIKNTASAIWKIYFVWTLLETILLVLAGMPVFDAVCNSLSTLSAGGFSPHPQSILGYNSNLINWILVIFMFLSGTSFMLQYSVITKKNFSLFFKNEEFKMYFCTACLFSLLVAASLIINNEYPVAEGITAAFYQVVANITSTASMSIDYTQWDFTAKLILFITLFTGACASSAGGGIKLTRWLLIFKTMKNELIKILHPHAVRNIKLDGKTVAPDVIGQIVVFVFFYFLMFGLTAILIALFEQNASIGLVGSISTLGNTGILFNGTFDALQPSTKIIMIINMIVGRLELIPFLVMFQRDFWSAVRE
jgi:trk system potassium uptake protein TrkH